MFKWKRQMRLGRMRDQPSTRTVDTFASAFSDRTMFSKKQRSACDIAILVILCCVCVALLVAFIVTLVLYISLNQQLNQTNYLAPSEQRADGPVVSAVDSAAVIQFEQVQSSNTNRVQSVSLNADGDNPSRTRTQLFTQLTESPQAVYPSGAVVSDSDICSEFGRTMLIYGGNAVDAAISVAVCLGAVQPQNSGLGGGMVLTYFDKSQGKCLAVDAREAAPSSLTENDLNNPDDPKRAWKSIGVPGALHGLRTAFERFGSRRIAWSQLLLPSVRLMLRGSPVDADLIHALHTHATHINASDSALLGLSSQYLKYNEHRISKIRDGSRDLRVGDVRQDQALAELLRKLSDERVSPINQFYFSSDTDLMLRELQANGAKLTANDFRSYESVVREDEMTRVQLPNGYIACTAPPPFDGARTLSLVNSIMRYAEQQRVDVRSSRGVINVFDKWLTAAQFINDTARDRLGDINFSLDARFAADELTSTKYAEDLIQRMNRGERPSTMQAQDKTHNEHLPRSAQVAVVDNEGNAVVILASLGAMLGSKKRSLSQGIIWNNAMDSFQVRDDTTGGRRPTENMLAGNKRPMSPLAPVIVSDGNNGQVRLALAGSTSGTVSYVATRLLLMDDALKPAMDAPRLLPLNHALYEQNFPAELRWPLRDAGHNLREVPFDYQTICHAIQVSDDANNVTTSKQAIVDYRLASLSFPAGY